MNYCSVPTGTYRVRVAELRPSVERSGVIRWALRLEVAAGEYLGRTACWQALRFVEDDKEGGMHVVKLLVPGYHPDTHNPTSLIDREATVTLAVKHYVDPLTGAQRTRHEVQAWSREAREIHESMLAACQLGLLKSRGGA